jgi:hypothetical protein
VSRKRAHGSWLGPRQHIAAKLRMMKNTIRSFLSNSRPNIAITSKGNQENLSTRIVSRGWES